MTILGTAIRIAAVAHENDMDKGGHAYILHTLAVMNGLGPDADDELKAIAVLHDLKEDHPEWTDERLRAEGMSERIITAINCLTHPKTETYEKYIKRVATNRDAIRCKMQDITHNTSLTRLKGLEPKDFERMTKYIKAYAFLQKVSKVDQEIY